MNDKLNTCDHLDGMSLDIEATEREKLRSLFPQCFSEGKLDIDKLLNLCGEYIDEDFEKYKFEWKGRAECFRIAGKRSTGTLRPCAEESVNFDTTQNVYIEGDNLEVLKLLQTSYFRKVKMIYIDPPYNTGNDFVYADDFKDPMARYKEVTQQTTKSNPETMGRFHTNWLNMMYPRLRLAANLLRDDGVIFISIDDNEVHNLRKLCDEIFGEENFVAELVWERAYSPKNDAKYISNSHDYVLMYAKNLSNFQIGRLDRTEEANARYNNPDNDPRGVWKPGDLSVKTYNAECDYPITTPSGRVVEPPTGRCWRQSKESFQRNIDDNRIWFGADGNSVPQVKRFLTELKFEGMAPTSIMFYKDVGHSQEGAKEVTALLESGAFDGPKPMRLLRRLLTLANTNTNDIILDFFSGSATTAHAVMRLNAEDGGNRKFIMVQLPEVTDEKSEAYKAGYKNICEIGKERIRRAGVKVSEQLGVGSEQLGVGSEKLVVSSEKLGVGSEQLVVSSEKLGVSSEKLVVSSEKLGVGSEKLGVSSEKLGVSSEQLGVSSEKLGVSSEQLGVSSEKLGVSSEKLKLETTHSSLLTTNYLDFGFRVFKLDTSNLVTWDAAPISDENLQTLWDRFDVLSNTIKADRSDMDIIFEVMLKMGVPLDYPVLPITVNNKKAYSIGKDCMLLVCLDCGITPEDIEAMCELAPFKIIAAEAGFADDTALSNAHYILRDKEIEMKLL